MPAPQPERRAWIHSSWVKWSWLLVLVVIVAQNLSYHLRSLPTSVAGYSARGRADYRNGELKSAVENFTKSITRQPGGAEAYIWRGESYARLHDLGRAMPDLDKALQLKPDYEKAHAAHADGLAAAWDAESAIQEYSRTLAMDKDYARCYLERGKLLYDTKRWNEAEADLRQSEKLLLDQSRVTAHLLLWLTRARAEDAVGATVELSDVLNAGRIRGDRFWTSARFLRGEIAEPAYLAAMAKTKDGDENELNAEAFFLAAVKRIVFGDRAGAVPLLQKALETDADASYAYDRARAELCDLLLGFHPMWIGRADASLAVASVAPGGPAEASGIRPGWALTAIDKADASQDTLIEFLAKAKPGSTVELQFIDGAGARLTVPLALRSDFSAPTR